MNKDDIIASLRSLHDLSKAINSTLDIDEVISQILDKASVLMGSDEAAVLLSSGDKTTLTLRGYLAPGSEETPPITTIERVRSFDNCIVRKGTVISFREIVPGDDYYRHIAKMPLLAEMVFAPLEIKGEACGLLGIRGGKEGFSKIELEIFCSLGSQAAIAIENANLYKRLKDTFLHTAEALAEAVGSRDPYTGGHTRRVVEYSLRIAGAIGISERERQSLKLAAILHDIGKIGIDDAILRKGGALAKEEEAVMRKHPEIGARILGHVEEMYYVIPGVCYHHEWFDGTGYPEGFKGEEIPLAARVIAVADAFDALTTDRPYRKAITRDAACEELSKGAGTHYDPSLVEAFRSSLESVDE